MLKEFINSKISQGAKSSIALLFASVITKCITYITTPLFTRMLTAEEYGQVSLFVSWQQIFGVVAMFGLSYSVFNVGMVEFPDKRNDYSFSMLILSNVITLCFTIILLCVYPFINELIGLKIPLVILMCAMFFFQPAYNFWTAHQRYEYKYKAIVFWALFSTVMSTVIAIVCVICVKDNKAYAKIFGAEASLIIIYVGFYLYLCIKNRFKLNTSYWKKVLIFNFPLIPHYLSTHILGSSDRFMISYLVDDAATAYYSLTYPIANVAMIIWYAVNASWTPFAYEKCKVKNYKAISDITSPILIMFSVVCVLVMMIVPEVVLIMAPSEYLGAIYAMPPIIAGVFFQVQYSLYGDLVCYYKKTKYILLASITSAVLNLILNYVFIKQFGYIAAGYTTLICYILQAIIIFFVMRRIVGHNVYNMRYVCFLSCCVIAICILSNLLYKFILIRYMIMMILIIIICFIKRDKIKEIFITVKNANRKDK